MRKIFRTEPNTTLIEIVIINLCSPRCFYTTFARQPKTSQSAPRTTCGNMTDSLARPEIWSALISRSRETKKTNQTWNMQSAELAKSKKPMAKSLKSPLQTLIATKRIATDQPIWSAVIEGYYYKNLRQLRKYLQEKSKLDAWLILAKTSEVLQNLNYSKTFYS